MRVGAVQTALASSRLRRIADPNLECFSERVLLELDDGYRTTCFVNRNSKSRGLVVLLHGWLGSPQATYVQAMAAHLYQGGFSVARLTLPEHGNAISLNPQFIDATRHDIVRSALQELCLKEAKGSVGLLGFSLGGNCALRIARDLKTNPIERLRYVFAVSPVINPADACKKIDRNLLIRKYFLKKHNQWFLDKKSAHPDRFFADGVLEMSSIKEVTAFSVKEWTDLSGIDEYFSSYTIGKDDLTECAVGVTLLSAADDPIVSVQSARKLNVDNNFECVLTDHGGHNGFFERLSRETYCEHLALDRFSCFL